MVVSASVAGVAGSCMSFVLPFALGCVFTTPAAIVVVRLSAFFVGGSGADVSMGLSLPATCALRFRSTGDVVEEVEACKSRQGRDETCTGLCEVTDLEWTGV